MDKKKEKSKSQVHIVGPYEPNFNGPVLQRGCTDLICFLLFLAVLSSYMALGVTAWLLGDPRNILYARNSTGAHCGAGINKLKPYVFLVDLSKCDAATNPVAALLNGAQCPTTQVCVTECPSEYWMLPDAAYAANVLAKDYFEQKYCDPRVDLQTTNLTVQEILDKDLCPSFYVPSTTVGSFCLTNSVLLNKTVNFTITDQVAFNDTVDAIKAGTSDIKARISGRGLWTRIYEDFAVSLHWILLGLAVAMVVSAISILLLRYMASVLVMTVIFGVLGVGAYGIYHCYVEYTKHLTSQTSLEDLSVSSTLEFYLQVKETWLAFMIIIIVFEVIVIFVIVSLGRSISFSVDLLEESNRVVSHVGTTVALPFLTFKVLVVCTAYWGMTSLYLVTSGQPLYRVVALNTTTGNCSAITGLESCTPATFDSSEYAGCPTANCLFYEYDATGLFQQYQVHLQVFNAVAFLWCASFFLTLAQCTLAGTFAAYYWTYDKSVDIPPNPIAQSLLRNLQFHVGSLAFGAGLFPFFQTPRVLIEFLSRKNKGSTNPISRCMYNTTYCCLNSFLQIMNSNTYVMISMYGNDLWVSAKQAHRLMKRNILHQVAMDGVAEVLLFFVKLTVTGTVGVLAFLVTSGIIAIPNDIFQASNLNYSWVPVIVVVVGAYLIAQAFISVYSVCVDTLFVCYMDDLERNDGSVHRPYYTTRNLMRILRQTESTILEA